MISDEEKAVLKTAKENYGLTSAEQKILVNLIEKQSKEIEEYKECERLSKRQIEKQKSVIKTLEIEIEELKEDRDKFKKALGKRITYCNELEKDLFENCSNYVVSKDKIKAKIEYYEKIDNPVGKRVLQSLLEKE